LVDVSADDGLVVGPRAIQLARLRADGFPVPDGFVLSTSAYDHLARAADLHGHLRSELQGLDPDDFAHLGEVSERLRDRVLGTPVPPEVDVAIGAELRRMMCRTHDTFEVRSSAVGEDAGLSFAGQFDSQIHVGQADLAAAFREVCASRFNARAIAYRMGAGVAEVECPMAVLFLRMIAARSSGVLCTRDPSNPRADTLLVTASWGPGFTGASTGDRFLVSRARRHAVVSHHTTFKGVRTSLLSEGDVREEAVPPECATMPSVCDAELASLATLALRIERMFGAPQDIEWAIDGEGAIWILQARALRLGADRARLLRTPRVTPIFTGGITIFPGRASGPVVIAESARDLGRVPDGSIVVLRHTCPESVKFLPRAGGLIVEFGNPAGHCATLVREYRVPAVFEAGEATRALAQTETASLDAAARRVYPGPLFAAEARDRVRHREAPPRHPVAERVTSLKLVDSSAWGFRASSCRSIHDVVRFAHEKAIQAVFTLGDEEVDEGRATTLESDVPIDLHVLDLGGGLAEETKTARTVRPEDIRSGPFMALWRGMSNPEVSWSGQEFVSPCGASAGVARAVSDRADEIRDLGARSYVAIAENYVNFNSRLACHHVMVDACIGKQQRLNLVNFRFKGGGTEPRREHFRARFLQECLRHYDFAVDIRHDLVNAWIRRLSRDATEERLDILGRLMACSCLLDMHMADEAGIREYVNEFLAGVAGSTPR
jgi:pyruvate,water dikinase